MISRFIQLPKAQKEIIDAWVWYEEREIGLGDDFKQEVADKIKLILKNPLHYPLKDKYHEALLQTYPFIILFDILEEEDLIVIVSVFHTSRHPKRKKR